MKKTFQLMIAVMIGIFVALPAFAADPPTESSAPKLGSVIKKVAKGVKSDLAPEGSGITANDSTPITDPVSFNGKMTLYKCVGTTGIPAKEHLLKGEKMILAKDFIADKTVMDDGTYACMGESEIIFIQCTKGEKKVITDPKDHPGVYWACFETMVTEPKLELPQAAPTKTSTSMTQ